MQLYLHTREREHLKDHSLAASQACKNMKFSNVSVPRGYEAAFQRAIWTFQHQRVFDPEARRVVHLKPLPPGGLVAETGVTGALPEDDPGLSFLGPPLDAGIMHCCRVRM